MPVENAQPTQDKTFNAAEFMASRNQAQHGKPGEPAKPAAAAPAKPAEGAAAAGEQGTPPAAEQPIKLPRSVRREMNRLRDEAAEWRGRAKAFEELGVANGAKAKPEAAPAAGDDPEPERKDFASDAEHNRALGRWDARQEANKALAERDKSSTAQTEQQKLRAHLDAMEVKAQEDMKALEDWDAVAEQASADGALEFNVEDHLQLMGMIAQSDVKAFVLYHLAKNQEELQKMLDLTKEPEAQIRAFHRLEGRIEKLYTSESKQQPAAQAGEKPADKKAAPPKDRISPEQGTAERDARKPKPSAEVTARGGAAPPEQPAIGTKAWMDRRNAAQFAR